ncbi:hypothetical protein PRUPE_5G212400 [Prunus persica]|uniref:Strictosidine synthase conserved region domain-containing protein n=1 Tax=Prunus persica TaxID=3760 RepID=A0A251PBQ8_PRUPE|nr:hypothetical protein PRUPE_5G212400 [Prunus persica]
MYKDGQSPIRVTTGKNSYTWTKNKFVRPCYVKLSVVCILHCREIHEANARHDATGRLMMFDPETKQVRVLLRGLSLAFGTASMDGSFVLVSEYAGKRIQKSWLTGPKANTSEIILDFGHHPVDINRSVSGDFWVAVNRETRLINHRGKLIVPNALLIDSDGAVLDEIILLDQYGNLSITQVEEVAGAL